MQNFRSSVQTTNLTKLDLKGKMEALTGHSRTDRQTDGQSGDRRSDSDTLCECWSVGWTILAEATSWRSVTHFPATVGHAHINGLFKF